MTYSFLNIFPLEPSFSIFFFHFSYFPPMPFIFALIQDLCYKLFGCFVIYFFFGPIFDWPIVLFCWPHTSFFVSKLFFNWKMKDCFIRWKFTIWLWLPFTLGYWSYARVYTRNMVKHNIIILFFYVLFLRVIFFTSQTPLSLIFPLLLFSLSKSNFFALL